MDVVDGAFSAPSHAPVRGRFLATFTAPGAPGFSRQFTKDASDYFVDMTQSGEAGCVTPVEPGVTINIGTRDDAGRLVAKLVIPLASYTNEAVALRLDDGDSSPLASASLGALRPWGGSGKVWQYSARGPGVKTVLLRDLGPRRPGRFQLAVLAARWFTAAAANQRAADTLLTVTIGAECVRHAATKKVD